MISKIYRLTEKNVKKVLQKGKPFFSYGIVVNYLTNTSQFNRFSLIVSSKSVKNSVERNYFRRLFFENMRRYLFVSGCETSTYHDYVFVVKKQNKLDKNDKSNINTFLKDISFLSSKLFNK